MYSFILINKCAKHLIFVDDGQNKYWLKLIKRAQTITMSENVIDVELLVT